MATHFASDGVTIGGEYVTAQAWINFSSSNQSIHNDYNVSSLSDYGVGDTGINFTTNIGTYYTAAGMMWSGNTDGNRGASGLMFGSSDTTSASGSQCRVWSMYGSAANSAGSKEDSTQIGINFFQ